MKYMSTTSESNCYFLVVKNMSEKKKVTYANKKLTNELFVSLKVNVALKM